MNRSRVRFLLFFSAFCLVEAQSPSTNPSAGGDAVSNFQPSLAVVIGILSVMFGLTFVLLLYTKCCHRGGQDDRILLGGINRSRRFSGIDKTVVESLPFFRFSSLRGSKQGLECAVCLSKFEDVELLRLLPKCKHGFHINCIDLWLEQHSSCPLCRHKITPEDPAIFAYSNSTRFSLHGDSSMDLYVQREEACGGGSSRFSIGSSFRKTAPKDQEEQQAPIRIVDDGEEEVLHKLNHRIVVSKNRWSNVSSSDLIFLNSEMMLNGMSSDRFPHLEDPVVENDGMKMKMKIKEEMDQKRLLESKVITNFPVPHPAASETGANAAEMSPKITGSERRVMSEITALSRFRNAVTGTRTGESSLDTTSCSNLKEDRTTRLWLPIARRTVEWFANREKRRQHLQPTTQNLNNIV